MKTLNEKIEFTTLQELVNFTTDKCNDLKGSSIYGCDLHNEIFNTDYFIIGYHESEKWLNANGGVFNAIGEIKEYEEDNFGALSTDISSSEKVINMYVYILGEMILGESEHLRGCWDNYLTDEDFDCIIEDLKSLIA